MIEPTTPTITSVSLLNLLVLLLGPAAGPYAFLLFGSLVGGWLAMSEAPTRSTTDAAKFLAGRMVLAMLFTFPLSWAVTQLWVTAPTEVLLGTSSCLIGWQWSMLTTGLLARLRGMIKGDAP